jgi:hypothetical protein
MSFSANDAGLTDLSASVEHVSKRCLISDSAYHAVV